MLKIKTTNGHECYIEDEDLKHYKNAEVLEEDADPSAAVEETEEEE
jgi:hypothetical protein